MENIDFASLFLFTFITIYTPGPANITCTSMGVKHGIKKSINFIYGSSIGFTFVALLGGLFSNLLLTAMPSLESIMRWVGAAYILYLAYNILKVDYSFAQDDKKIKVQPLNFKHGVLIQLLNPKSIIFLLTLYTAFLHPIANNPIFVLLFTLILGIIGFGANFLWASLGAGLSHFLNQERIKKAVNLILALLLVYTSARLTGIFKFLV